MIKIVLFDTDGVVIRAGERFSSRLSKMYGIPMEKISPFFQNEFQRCLAGQADLKRALNKYIGSWGWPGTIEELLAFWFEGEDDVDKNILREVSHLKERGVKCYIHTNNEKYRVAYLLDSIGLKHAFNGVFASSDLGVLKPSRVFWEKVQITLGDVSLNEVIVWDDDTENVVSAADFGYHARLYTGFEDYQAEMERFTLR